MDVLVRHQCFIYESSPAKHLPGLAALILAKLNSGYRCLVLNSPAMLADLRSYLEVVGIEVDAEVGRGALVLSSDQGYLVDGQFDFEKMLNAITSAVNEALRDSYAGLWATGDMTWEFGGEKNFDKLLAYELGLERLFHVHPALSGVCQYRLDTLPNHALQTALRTHPGLYINETLSRINPNWIPGDAPEMWSSDLAAERLDEFIRHLTKDPKLSNDDDS